MNPVDSVIEWHASIWTSGYRPKTKMKLPVAHVASSVTYPLRRAMDLDRDPLVCIGRDPSQNGRMARCCCRYCIPDNRQRSPVCNRKL